MTAFSRGSLALRSSALLCYSAVSEARAFQEKKLETTAAVQIRIAAFTAALFAAMLVDTTLAQSSGGGAISGASLTTSLAPDTEVRPGQVVEFTVESTHPQRDSVSLVLLNPPPGCVFTQDRPTAPPAKGSVAAGSWSVVTATAKVRWLVPFSFGGFRRLSFRAIDHTHPAQTLSASVDVRVLKGQWNAPIVIGDVTGDGVFDTVAGATYADVSGIADTGAVYVWNGSTAPSGVPGASLLVSKAKNGDRLGFVIGQGIQLADVTGDGVQDVIVGTVWADIAGKQDIGAIYVWQGGSSLNGSPAPLATLTVPGATAGDLLGWTGGQGIQLADVTGDRVADVVAGTQYADVAGVVDVGALYVWAGGPTLTGSPAPLATLTVAGATAYDGLGNAGFLLADVTGDRVLDVLAGASSTDMAGVIDVGAIYVWKGGPTLNGSPVLLATLTVPGAITADHLSLVQVVDVTGDGTLDVVGGAAGADVGGVADVGAIYVWKGGSTLAGSLTPLATLTVPGAVSRDRLGYTGAVQGILFVDVSGDGLLDVVAGASTATVAGVSSAGAIYVWKGGPTLSGSPALLATLMVSGAVANDDLGSALLLSDVSGDGVLDVVAGATHADVGGVVNAGAIYVWEGGSKLGGSPAPRATLTVSGAVAYDLLGTSRGQSIQLVDVTGEGVLDVIAGTSVADVGGVTDAGALYVWKGGSALRGSPAPLATLTVSGAVAFDSLGDAYDEGFQLADVTADGVMDVVAGARLADVAGVVDAGAVYVWQGGSTLTGTPAPLATLTVPGAHKKDWLGLANGQGVLIADVTGDGVLDVVAGASYADSATKTNVGAIYVWNGGPALSGSLAPDAALMVSSAVNLDMLGIAGGEGIQLADVTGDGVLDVVAGAMSANVFGVVDTGALYLWTGGPSLSGSPAMLARLYVPLAKVGDEVGY